MKVVTARYGFELEEPKASRNCATLQEIGDAEHKTRERVRQVQETAMQKLRSRLATVCLEPFYIFFVEFIGGAGDIRNLRGCRDPRKRIARRRL